MSTFNLVSLIVMTLVFLLWVVLMFRMLWRLTLRSWARLDQTGGGFFTWMGHSLAIFGEFFTSDENRTERRRLYLVTALLFATIIARPLLLTGGQ